jgi:hypothetical protein
MVLRHKNFYRLSGRLFDPSLKHDVSFKIKSTCIENACYYGRA